MGGGPTLFPGDTGTSPASRRQPARERIRCHRSQRSPAASLKYTEGTFGQTKSQSVFSRLSRDSLKPYFQVSLNLSDPLSSHMQLPLRSFASPPPELVLLSLPTRAPLASNHLCTNSSPAEQREPEREKQLQSERDFCKFTSSTRAFKSRRP